ncbi:hypothetical protein BRD56_05915 [Thermoplasmatales archaeon SW_10_69_26]|nr:MAG: hypothetical protein BRD56_05915 [Thermoplasmatales archaeon SW_10_69_26]
MSIEKAIEKLRSDEGVSPVIAVILMVAITVVLAATVYVWVSGFASEQDGPEQASATAKAIDLNDNGDEEWIQVTLTQGENAAYKEDDVTYSATDSDGNSLGDAHLCVAAQNGGASASDSAQGECLRDHGGDGTLDTADETERFFTDLASNDWDVGEYLYLPCQKEGNHIVTMSVRDSTILDVSIDCKEMPKDTT